MLPFIFIFITGQHPTPARPLGPGGRALRMRRTRRARVLLKDMPPAARRKCLFSVPEVASPTNKPGSSGRGRLAGFPHGLCFPALCPAPRSLALCVLLREGLPLPSASFRIPRPSLPPRGELLVERECGPAGGELAAERRSARLTSGSLCPEPSGLFMARPRRAQREGGGGAALPR